MTKRTKQEDYVLKAARKYARMKLFGTTLDTGGHIVVHPPSERDGITDWLATSLLKEAELLINIMSLDEEGDHLVE